MTNRARTVLPLSVAVVVIFVDQLTKFIALELLTPFEYVPVLGDLIGWRLAFNDRAAFSLGGSNTWIFTLTSTIAMLLLIYFVPKSRTKGWLWLGGFALGGVVGNLIDRITKAPGFPNGHVVDFIQIPFNFPVFNLADMAICISAFLIVIKVIRGEKIGGTQ